MGYVNANLTTRLSLSLYYELCILIRGLAFCLQAYVTNKYSIITLNSNSKLFYNYCFPIFFLSRKMAILESMRVLNKGDLTTTVTTTLYL